MKMTNNKREAMDAADPSEPGAVLVHVDAYERGGKTVSAYDYWRGPNGENLGRVEYAAPPVGDTAPTLSKKHAHNEPSTGSVEHSYSTPFNLSIDVSDIDAANDYLHDDDMTEYLPDSLKPIVTSVRWNLDSASHGTIDVSTKRELTDDESNELSEWISGQNSDGLGEGFEQQPFAMAEDDEDDEYDPYSTMASFDWEDNKYELKRTDDNDDNNDDHIDPYLLKNAAHIRDQRVLDMIARSNDVDAVRSVAANKNTRPSTLATLSDHGDASVRWAVARNYSTPPDTIRDLAGDDDADVRIAVSTRSNPRPSDDIIEKLAGDDNAQVRAAVTNNVTSLELLEKLGGDDDAQVRASVGLNPYTMNRTLDKLAGDSDATVRRAIALNPSTSLETLGTLSRDSDNWVARYADSALRGGA